MIARRSMWHRIDESYT